MALSGQTHNSRLKQKNKKHNVIGHRSKRQLSSENKGRVSAKIITQKYKKELKREQRKLQSKQIRANKREEALGIKRQLGTAESPPFLVSIVPLNLDINPKKVLHYLTDLDSSSVCSYSDQGIAHLSCRRLKQRFSFAVPPVGDLYSTLDVVKGSDTILFVWKIGEEVNDAFNLIISSLLSQGYPSVLHAVVEDEELPSKDFDHGDLERELKNFLVISDQPSNKGHKKIRMLKDLQMDIQSRFQGNSRPYFLNKVQDVNLLLRQIGSQKLKSIFYKDKRSHVVAESLTFEGEGSTGSLKIVGYIRSQPLSVNRLIHIPGWGDFQLSQVEEILDPFPLDSKKRREDRKMNVYFPDPELQESLESTFEMESVEEEEEWCVDGAIVENENVIDSETSKQRGPRGYSSYQAAWMIDDNDARTDDEEEEDDEDFQAMEDDSCPNLPLTDIPNTDDEDSEEEIADAYEDAEDDRTTLTDIDNDYDANVDYKEEMDFLTKLKAAREDAEFPDEMDTPQDIPARVRFQKYRGLESFHCSPWDKNDRLPPDYKRILHLKSFVHRRNRILKEREGMEPGEYVCLTINDVPKHLYLDHVKSQSPLVVFSLLPLEQKMSLVHVAIKSHSSGHIHPIRSKERLIFHLGFRRYANCPIFSEHSSGDKHKFLRYFQPGDTVVASMYAPITFPPCPVTVYRERPSGTQELVAVGSVIYPDPSRIICKKIAISGHPFKIATRHSVIRYMFYNREDIFWFKSIMIRTKLGRKGHIVEPIGTHGHMKCVFDKQIQSHDTIVMNLYKRVFPKWRFDPAVPRPRPFYITTEKERVQEPQIEPHSKKKKVQFQEGFH